MSPGHQEPPHQPGWRDPSGAGRRRHIGMHQGQVHGDASGAAAWASAPSSLSHATFSFRCCFEFQSFPPIFYGQLFTQLLCFRFLVNFSNIVTVIILVK